MVRAMQGLMVLLWFTSTAHAALDVKLDKSRSPLGEPLLLQIKSADDLSALDLSPIKQNFDIASQTINRVSSQNRDQYLLEATLYPLRSGVLTVPKLTLGTLHSPSVNILIQPAHVSMLAWFPPGMPMEREATVLHLEIRDDGNLNWDTPIQIDAPYATVRALPESTREEAQDGIKRVVHHFRWQILPLKEGNLTVSFGLLDAHRYAQRLRFPMSNVSLNVRAAPAFVPLNLPIGKPTIRVDPKPRRIIAGKPVAWNIYIFAPGLSVEGAHDLLQYAAPPGLRFYPPSITPVMLDGEDYLRITLSFIADRTARLFPSMQLPYFDLQQQRVETRVLPASSLQVRDLVRERLVAASILAVSASLLVLLSWLGWRLWQRMDTKRRWLAKIDASHTPSMLHAALTKDSPWCVRSLRSLPARLNIDTCLTAELEQACFGVSTEPDRFIDLHTKWAHVIANMPTRFFRNKSYINHANYLTLKAMLERRV